jgi:hypothetical protein
MLGNSVFYGTRGKDNRVKNVPRNIQRQLNNVQLLVIRIGGRNKSSFIDSKPCKHCINYMRSLGLKKIYYTDSNGSIIYEKVRDMQSEHVSMVRKVLGI